MERTRSHHVGNASSPFEPTPTGGFYTGDDSWGRSAAPADFDQDGTLDYAVAVSGGVLVTSPLGSSFPWVPLAACPGSPLYNRGHMLSAGDFDEDGTVDLLAWCPEGNIRFMQGTGTSFVLGDAYPVAGPGWPHDRNTIIAVDLNLDGHLDVVTAHVDTSTWHRSVSILFGDGTGTFGAPAGLPSDPDPYDLVVADFNEDGVPDVAGIERMWWEWVDSTQETIVHDGSVALFLSATNTPVGQDVSVSPTDPTTGGTPVAIRFAEVTLKGYTSVRTSFTGPEVPDSYFPGLPLTYYWLATEAHHTGPVEICVSYAGISYANESSLKLLQGAADGTWRDVDTSLDAAADRVCGLTDTLGVPEVPFLVAMQGPGLPGIGVFGAPRSFPLAELVYDAATADFNGDGLDVAIASVDESTGASFVDLLLGDGAGGLGAPASFAAGVDWLYYVASTDFNNDGSADVAAASDGTVQLLLGNGHGGLGSPTTVYTSASGGNGYLLANDFNHDARVDLAVLYSWREPGGVVILLGDGAGGFSPPTQYFAGYRASDFTAADFNADWNLDLAISHMGTASAYAGAQEVLLLLGDGAGAFGQPQSVPSAETYACEAGDFNDDGLPDLVTAGGEDTVSVLIGDQSGGFTTSAVLRTADVWPWQVRAADFNGDGHLDIASMDNSTATVRLGSGDGLFGPRGAYPISDYPTGLRVADMNNDRRPDIILLGFPHNIWVFPNISTNTSAGEDPPPLTPVDSTTGAAPVEITFDNVTSAGFTSLVTAPTGPPLPEGFRLGTPPTYYDIMTTASYSGLIQVCINYTGVSYGNEANLRLFHRLPDGAWEDITSSLDTANDVICGLTASLSPFVIAYPEDATPPTITLVTPQDGASYLLDAAVLAAYSCEDAQSGVQACSGPSSAARRSTPHRSVPRRSRSPRRTAPGIPRL